ncbi:MULTISPECIES: HAD family hydrolase [unclassified Caballeronia]|uniref:HAD family hydrolase n=1 Tax=unclassified Caballeronia TaxID=2646786 RepID=UPI002029AAEC|nr:MULTISPECIES: HAD family hydrolase [unclassified Caballeronia]
MQADKNVLPDQLAETWSARAPSHTVATFDCFDTLFWRAVQEPVDVYYALAEDPLFVEHGVSARVRTMAESEARKNNYFATRKSEATLEQIYAEAAPHADEAIVSALAEREVDKEIEIGFIFEPVLGLLREAKIRGLHTAIVSDTYYSEAQLRRILFTTAPELESLIDVVFCSSEFGVSKSTGLWNIVTERLGVAPSEILHTGDNPYADWAVPQQMGIGVLHFQQRDDEMHKADRQRLMAARVLFPSIRATKPAPSLHHAMRSLQQGRDMSTNERIGYWSVGPIMHAFARFVLDTHEDLKARGRPHKLAFLLRDGHLIHRACEALHGSPIGNEAYVGRFVAAGSTFDSREAIERYLSTEVINPQMMKFGADQLQLPPKETGKLLAEANASANPLQTFRRLVLEPRMVKLIIERSAALRQRLFRHLQRTVGLERGDTLVIVDLGYYGSIQRSLGKLFKKYYDVEIVGRYLVSLDTPGWRADRAGVVDSRWADENVMEMLIAHIGHFEQMCSLKTGSVYDFKDDGTPLLNQSAKSEKQIAQSGEIQDACVRFVRDMAAMPATSFPRLTPERLRVDAAICLARLLYLPDRDEVAGGNETVFEINGASIHAFNVADNDAGIEGLRQRGPFYMRSIGKGFRPGYPYEMRHAGIDQAIFLMAVRRHRLDFTVDDTTYRETRIPALFVRGNETATETLTARATYDGFYSLVVPISDFDVALMFGQEMSWMQIASATTFPADTLDTRIEFDRQRALSPGSEIIYDGMTEREPGMFEMSPNGLIYVPAMAGKTRQLMRLTFRPLSWVQKAEVALAS